MLHLLELVNRVLRANDEPQTGGYFTMLDVVSAVNNGYQHYCALAREARGEAWFGTFADLATVAQDNKVSLPMNLDHLISVQVISVTGSPFAAEGIYKNGIVRKKDSSETTVDANWLDYLYAVFGDDLYFWPSFPATSSAGLRLFYAQQVPNLLLWTLPSAPSDGLTLPLPLTQIAAEGQDIAEPFDSVYNGTYVYILTGGHANKVRKIAGYTGSTRVATLDTTLGSAMAQGDQVAMIPRLPKQFHDMLALYAIIQLRQEKEEDFLQFAGRLQTHVDVFNSTMDDRTEEASQVQPWDADED